LTGSDGAALGDPKRGFLSLLEALEAAPGVRDKTPPALHETLEAMPPASFAFAAPPLEVTERVVTLAAGKQRHEVADLVVGK
jgi:hypothetical protein